MNSFSIWHWMVILVVLVILLSPAVIGMMVMGTQRSVAIRHEPSGLLKKRFYGYSWTYLLFGFFVPIFCGEISIGLLHIILNILTLGVFQAIMSYLYNRQYMDRQLTTGWALADTSPSVTQARTRLKIAA